MAQPNLVARLRAALDFDAASRAALASLEARGDPSAPRPWAQLLRGLVHRRTAQGYEGLASLLFPRGERLKLSQLGPTTSAWRWVNAAKAPILLDVLGRQALLVGAEGPPQVLAESDALSEESAALLGEATHVVAAPLRGIDEAIGGVLSLELQVTGLRAPELADWRRLLADLADLADLAGPYLLGKPLPQGPSGLEDGHLPVVGEALRAQLGTLERLARFGDTILLRGPPGAGKSCLARWLHARSPQARGPFVTLQLQNLPDELVPGELFGWRRGAHSTATADKRGLVESAQGGVLFLDEIGAVSWETQGRILQLLDTGRYRALGDEGVEQRARVRFLLATNEDLESAVRERRFRADLYERIAGASFVVPPLARRRDEIGRWARYFLDRRARQLGIPIALDDGAVALLAGQDWPGNLRQLEQVMNNALALGADQGTLRATHVRAALDLRGGKARGPLAEELARIGRVLARAAEGPIPLRLEQLDVLRAYALAAAVEEVGIKEAFLRFHEDRLVASRNYNQAWTREQDRLEAFEALVGQLSSSEHEVDRVQNTKPGGPPRRK